MSEIRKALVRALAELENPTLDGTNPHFRSRYVTLAGLENHVRPVLAKHGLAVLQPLTNGYESTGPGVMTVILHESGEELVYGPVSLPLVKADPQAAGSAITYARRYALAAVLGISGEEDDDANAATVKPSTPPQRPSAPPPAKSPGSGYGLKVASVTEKSYNDRKTGQPKPWWSVEFSDGSKVSTFSATDAKHARSHASEHSPCSPLLKAEEKGTKLTGFACCELGNDSDDEGWAG